MATSYRVGMPVMTIWDRPFSPASPVHIERFEQCIGSLLPPAYRNYLLSQNGGIPSEYLEFKIPEIFGDVGRVMLGAMYGIGERGSGIDLETQYEELDDVVPQGHIPIGEDPGGNLLLLVVHGPSRERIVFWERVGLFASQQGKTLFPIADDINRFLESLRVMPDV
jgi:hypothetical protein